MNAAGGEPHEQALREFPVAYIVSDVLFVDGADLTGEPWERRREILEELVVPSETFQLSPVTEQDGVALFQAAVEDRVSMESWPNSAPRPTSQETDQAIGWR
jgi:ATP-dependent DNA ligase